jgi:hypothetical protein
METWEYKKVSFVADDEVLNTYGKKVGRISARSRKATARLF